MNVVDTSGWLEFFTGGVNAKKFLPVLKQTDTLLVPTICLYEVSKVILRESNEKHMLQALAIMQKATIIDLTPRLSLSASRLSLQHKLPMADSIILATTYAYDATLWTQDIDFMGIPSVNYFAKSRYTIQERP